MSYHKWLSNDDQNYASKFYNVNFAQMWKLAQSFQQFALTFSVDILWPGYNAANVLNKRSKTGNAKF